MICGMGHMRICLLIAFHFLLLISLVNPVLATDRPCINDTAKFCSSVKFNKTKLRQCLDDHSSQLSDPCKNHRENRDKRNTAISTDCASESSTYCSGLTGDALNNCLRANRDHLSKACGDHVSKIPRGSPKKKRAACRYEVGRFCSNVKGTQNIQDCLAKHQDSLSALCAQTIVKKQARKSTTESCDQDIPKYCGHVTHSKRGRYPVLVCLNSFKAKLSEGCQKELESLAGLDKKEEDEIEKTDETEKTEGTTDETQTDETDKTDGTTDGGS